MGCGTTGIVPGACALLPGAPTSDPLGGWRPSPTVCVRLGVVLWSGLGWGWVGVGLGLGWGWVRGGFL